MQYMLMFSQDTAEFDKAKDPGQAGPYFGAWQAYMGAMGKRASSSTAMACKRPIPPRL